MLMHRHINKGGGKQAIYRGAGSIGLVGACRSAWLVGRDPVDPGRCVLAQVKNNLAARQPSLAYSVSVQDAGPPRLTWLGWSTWSADQLLSGQSRGRARARAREFLLALLEPGARAVREIWAEAQKQGLAVRTLMRVKREQGIRSVRVDSQGRHQTYWLLAGQELPAGLAGPSAADDLEPWLAPLRRQFPPRTPLDEE
jgi:hypothetical protein